MRTNNIVLTASLCFHPHVAKSWVIYSPMEKKAATKAYEDGYGAVWRGRTSFPLDQYTLRWGLPQSAYSNEALGGGITFALHKNFCDRVLPLFPESADHLQWSTVLENTFLTCVDLRDTVKRAMDTWAINHRRIYFRDVTDQCLEVESYEACPAAELFIVPSNADSNAIITLGDAVAYVTHDRSNLDFAPFSTSGVQIQPGLGIRSSRMVIKAPESPRGLHDFCFYLDTTFCYGFHRWSDSMTKMRVFFMLLYVLSVSTLAMITVFGARATCRASKADDISFCRWRRCSNLLEYLSEVPTITVCLACFILIFCPICAPPAAWPAVHLTRELSEHLLRPCVP